MVSTTYKSNPKQRGFTLVELMVAMSLGVIMTGAIVYIFVQSQKMFTKMEAKVSVYQYARSAFDMVERDLSNVVKTADMEFFQDSPTRGVKGHYDPQSGDPEAIPLRDKGQRPHFLFSSSEKYIYAMTLSQPPPYKDTFKNEDHRNDSLYFRTVTSINGQTQPVLVEYALDYKKRNGSIRPLPTLVRRHWSVTKIEAGVGGAPKITVNGNAGANVGKNEPIEMEVCLYVTDIKFEFYLKDKRTGRPGRFYSAEEAIRGPLPGKPNYPRIKMRNLGNGQGHRISCFYDHRHAPSGTDLLKYDRAKNLFITAQRYHFPMSQVGDRLFIYGADVPALKPRDLTIKSIEPLPAGPGDSGGPARFFGIRVNEALPNLDKDPRMRFRSGWLPPMVRMTLRIKDQRAKAIRTLVRQFKLLGA